jgi:hypothetical protein
VEHPGRAGDADWWRDHLAGVPLPRWVPVQQRFPTPTEPDVAAAVRRELKRPDVRRHLRPGARVALGIGSRGLAGLAEIVIAAIAALREAGCEPFVVPAMGSHGGASAEGQLAVLAGYGVSEQALGVPVRSGMEAAELGRLANGMPVYFDQIALGADLALPINRIKSHTSFRGPIESGLAKMLVIGFGNHLGAEAIHARGYRRFAANLLEARDLLLPQVPFRFGIATVENAAGEVARVEAVTAEALAEREPALLREAKALLPRLPVPDPDLLIIDLLGKDISGVGIDPGITGRYAGALRNEVAVERLVVLGLTPASKGNAIGLGLADITTEAVADAVDLDATWINATTSTSLAAARLPIAMPSAREALRLALRTCGQPDPERVRGVWIEHTGALEEVRVTEALATELEGAEGVSQFGPPVATTFGPEGALREFG